MERTKSIFFSKSAIFLYIVQCKKDLFKLRKEGFLHHFSLLDRVKNASEGSALREKEGLVVGSTTKEGQHLLSFAETTEDCSEGIVPNETFGVSKYSRTTDCVVLERS